MLVLQVVPYSLAGRSLKTQEDTLQQLRALAGSRAVPRKVRAGSLLWTVGWGLGAAACPGCWARLSVVHALQVLQLREARGCVLSSCVGLCGSALRCSQNRP